MYLIVNLVNGKTYVGSAIMSRIGNRFQKHLFGGSGSALVFLAVQKYGLGKFAFILIDTVPSFNSVEGNAELLALENKYIQLLTPSYNIAPVAGNTFAMVHTEETKAFMKANYSLAHRETIGALNRGKTFSPETIGLMTAAAMQRAPMTPESRALVSLNSARAELFEVSLLDGNPLSNGCTSITLRTIQTVADYVSCHEKTVRRALTGSGIIRSK